MGGVKHSTTKSSGQCLSSANWNAEHVGTSGGYAVEVVISATEPAPTYAGLIWIDIS